MNLQQIEELEEQEGMELEQLRNNLKKSESYNPPETGLSDIDVDSVNEFLESKI